MVLLTGAPMIWKSSPPTFLKPHPDGRFRLKTVGCDDDDDGDVDADGDADADGITVKFLIDSILQQTSKLPSQSENRTVITYVPNLASSSSVIVLLL